MTLVGFILMTVVQHSTLFEDPTLAVTQLMLPSQAACDSAARYIESNKLGSAYCIPVYDKS